MLCQNCGKNEANVRYTQIINGVKKEINLCDECARKLGIGSFEFNMPIHFSDFLGDLFNDYQTDLLPTFVKESENCDFCKSEYDNFIKTGLLGCPECYETFETRLDPILKKLQGSTKHVGRGITKLENIENKNHSSLKEEKNEEIKSNAKKIENDEKTDKTSLEENLKVAIKEERYEDAAKIRDELKKFKN